MEISEKKLKELIKEVSENNIENTRLIALENIMELGQQVNAHLNSFFKTNEDYIIPIKQVRFSNGEGKVVLLESVRNKDVYILCDVGNYESCYKIRGQETSMTPDEHWQDIKRIIAAIRGNAAKITVVMPLLYESRQHRRNGRESLDCAIALQELERMGVNNIITFDVHDRNIQNAIPLLPFDSFWPTKPILESFFENENLDFENLLLISPDEGAIQRTRYYSAMLKCDIGLFYKRRDYSIVVNGKCPIVEHKYLGKEQTNLNYIIVDDMVASGGSVIEIIEELVNKEAQNIYVIATFALFTEGVEKFDDAYNQGKLTKLYTTNLSYIPEEIKNKPWLECVDCSSLMAEVISTYIKHESVSPILNGKREMYDRIQALKASKKES